MKFTFAAVTFIPLLLVGVSAKFSRMNRIEEALHSYQKNNAHPAAAETLRPPNSVALRTINHGVDRPTQMDNTVRRRETLLNHITGMNTLELITMEDNKMCANENDNLSFFFNSHQSPYWFYYLGNDNFLQKDFSSYFECINAYPDYFNCDFTNMLELSVAPCQAAGGTMYSVSSNLTCSEDVDEGTMYNDTNLPICLGSSCAFNESSVRNNDNFNFCVEASTFDIDVKKIESLISEECKAENQYILETSGTSNPDFIFNLENIDIFELYCVSGTSSDGTINEDCDFTPLLQDYREPCEAQGGILYKYSDMVNFTEGYYGDAPFESTYKNIPICIGKSCHAKTYFEKLVFPYLAFYLEGDFYQREDLNFNQTYYSPPNYTYHYSSTYKATEYAPVLETENPYTKFLLKFQLIGGEQVDNTKMCKWLAKKTEDSKEKICTRKRYQVYSEQSGVGPASLVCAETCAPYCHEEKAGAKFVYAYDDVKGLITKQCNWLERESVDVIDSVCNTTVDVGEETIYGQAAETCTRTCGSC